MLRDNPVEEAAPYLLGSHLITHVGAGQIVEVEAYAGPRDPGSHAFSGKPTARTATMFGEAGHAYIYFTYGSHWMLNVSAHPPGTAGGILIRAAKPIHGLEAMRKNRPKAKTDRDLLSGPGKICAALAIDRRFEGADLFNPASPIFIKPNVLPLEALVSTRIGLSPGRGDTYPWRFIDAAELDWASRPWPSDPARIQLL